MVLKEGMDGYEIGDVSLRRGRYRGTVAMAMGNCYIDDAKRG